MFTDDFALPIMTVIMSITLPGLLYLIGGGDKYFVAGIAVFGCSMALPTLFTSMWAWGVWVIAWVIFFVWLPKKKPALSKRLDKAFSLRGSGD